MTTERKRIKRGRAPRGDRHVISVRYPPDFHDGLMEGAELCRVPLGHYIVYRAARCEGWAVPVEELRAIPTLILLYDAEEWPAMLEGLPTDVVEVLRLKVPEVADFLPAPVSVGNGAYARAVELRDQGLNSWHGLANQLNAEGLRTARGARWYPQAVKKLISEGPPPADDPAPTGEQETSGRRRAARTRKKAAAHAA